MKLYKLKTDDQLTAIGYLEKNALSCGGLSKNAPDFKAMKAEREQGWIELGKKLSLSREYHFFLFIIVSTGDVHT